MSLAEILKSFPPEQQPAIALLAETLREEYRAKTSDFDDVKAVVRDLAEAQKRTESRIEELAQAQLALAEAQKRTELRVEELAQAQKRTEARVEELAQNLATLTYAVQRNESALERFHRTFEAKIGGLGARWGLQTEESFREGMRAILQEVGFTVERFWDLDTTGEVFGIPDQVELDAIIKNGKVIVVEIKSSLDKGAVYQFARKAEFYARKTGRHVDRKLIVTPYADPGAQDVATKLGVEVCTDVHSLQL